MISANGDTYWYDTAGRSYYTKIGTTTHEFIYDVNGNKIGGSQTNPQVWALGQIYAGSWHIASYAAATTLFNHADWLGTVRVVTGANGAVVNSYSSLPFGDCLLQNGYSNCTSDQVGYVPSHFTDQDRDTETGLDHFLFRQYSSVEGRWLTPDPAGMAAVDQANPQTWNRYAYVANNPINMTDRLGLCVMNGGLPTSTGVDQNGDQTFTYSTDNTPCPFWWVFAYQGGPFQSVGSFICMMMGGCYSNPQQNGGGGGGGSSKPSTPAPPIKKPWNPCRTKAIIGAVADLGLGALKIGLGVAGAAETGGLSLYGAWSGVTNLVSAGGELYGGISGNLAGGERVANFAGSVSTISGTVTLIATGNASYGSTASTIEGLAFVGITGGLTSTGTMKAAGALDNAVSAADNGIAAGGLAGIGGCHD